MFFGSTVHFIDSGVDTGCPILQGAFPRDPNIEIKNLRHRVFLQQVISLIQVVYWFNSGKIKSEGNLSFVLDAKYELSEFSPNLDYNLQKLYESWLESAFQHVK
jgi:phosphoribosylglycinamide formyltransferase-1